MSARELPAGAGGRLRRWSLDCLLAVASLALCFAGLELAARLLGLAPHVVSRRVEDVDPNKPIAFLPGHRTLYETGEFRFELQTNRFGRRDVEWSPSVMADPDNLLFIGDSMVIGYGVEDADSIPTRLESLLSRPGHPVEVLNFAMPAVGIPEYRELLEEAGRLGIGAHTLLLGLFVGNDFYANSLDPPQPPTETPPKPRPRRPHSQLLSWLKGRLTGSPRVVGAVLTLGGIFGITVYDTAGSYIFLRRQTPEQKAIFRRILERVGGIAELARAQGRELRVVIFPNKLQVENASALSSALYDARLPNRLILDYCRQIGLSCLDLTPALSRAHETGGQPLFYPVDRHLTPRGTEVAAAEIASFLGREAAPAPARPGS